MDIFKIINKLQSYSDEAVMNAVDLLVKQGERIADYEEQLRWIPAAEMLPERGQQVIVYCPPKVFAYHFWNKDFDSFHGVTHWMPMPEPPQEVQPCSR